MSRKTQETCSLKLIDEELKQFLEFCKDNNLDQEKIFKICEPLLRPKQRYFWLRLFIILSLIFIICLHFYAEWFYWHLSAIGRILLIKTLPLYDWQHLKMERCLINSNRETTTVDFKCYHCEASDSITFSVDSEPQMLKEYFLDLDLPVVFLWNSHNFLNSTEKAVSTLLEIPNYPDSIPCKLATNLLKGSGHNVRKCLSKIKTHPKYFMHYLNCDFDAVKAFRKVFPRPEFLVSEISPVQYSWVLASKAYDSPGFKSIQLRERITAVLQIMGTFVFRLHPLKDCEMQCSTIEVKLEQGEALLFTNFWELEYKTLEYDENFAVILEAH